MPGYRLGNGTETDAREAANRGLPPIWKPYNPLHYFSFAYWAYTFNFSDLDMSKKFEFDRRIQAIAPWFVVIVIWASLVGCLVFVELSVIPHSHSEEAIFPYTPTPVAEEPNDDAKENPPRDDTSGSANLAESNHPRTTSASGDEKSDHPESKGANKESASDNKTQEEVEASAQKATITADPKFLDIYLGVPGSKKSYRNLLFGLLLIAIAIFVIVRYSDVLGGFVALVISFAVSALVSTKVFYWLVEPKTRVFFICTRFLECALLLIMATRLKTFHTLFLRYMGPVLAVFTSSAFAIAMMTTEAQLVLATSIVLPLFIILIAAPILPIIRGSLAPKETFARKLALWLVAVAPFCIAAFLNWWFHIAWIGDIDMPKVSYKNTLVIYLLGLVFGCSLLLLRHVSVLSTKRFSWPLLLSCILLILHIFLINNLLSTYPLHSTAHERQIPKDEL